MTLRFASRRLLALAFAAPILALATRAAVAATPTAKARLDLGLPDPTGALTLTAGRDLELLRRFAEPWIERPGEWRSFWTGRFGPGSWSAGRSLAWSVDSCDAPEPAERSAPMPPAASYRFADVGTPRAPVLDLLGGLDLAPTWSLASPVFPELLVGNDAVRRCSPGQHPYEVTLARYGGEHDRFRLLECDGAVALEALDRLSVIARPPGVVRPELPLPLEADPATVELGEWLPEVRLLDPRLLWVVARLSEAFPQRALYVISGYRRDGHGSFHKKGRALDLFVMGVPNEAVLRVCRTLKDVGCGYYPNNKFLHVDVRPPGTGHALWIDVSSAGEPSRYVDGWPGVIESGALAWAE